MASYKKERRREPRYPVHAKATLELAASKEPVPANIGNLSAAGVFLTFPDPVRLAVGDEVSCVLKVRHGAGPPLPCWGLGRVVRVEGQSAAIELTAAGFDPAPDAPGPPEAA